MPPLKARTKTLRAEIRKPSVSDGSEILQPAKAMTAALDPFLRQITKLEQMFAESELANEDASVIQTYESSVQLLRALKRHTDDLMQDMRAIRSSRRNLETDLETIASRMDDFEKP